MKTKTNQNLKGIAIELRLVDKLNTYQSLVMDLIGEGNPTTATCWNNDIKVAYNLLHNRYCLIHGIELDRRKQNQKIICLSNLMRLYKDYRPN